MRVSNSSFGLCDGNGNQPMSCRAGGIQQGMRCLKNHGFALVVTLTLMILLTILAVGMMTITSVAMRAANVSSATTVARNNARLGLMLAIAELQKQAGPDQRVTATADMAAAAGGNAAAVGVAPANNTTINGLSKGLSAVQSGTRYWTGVWRDSNLTAFGVTTPGVQIFTKTPSPTFLQWLVSGNETGSASITPAHAVCALKGDGSVADPATAVVLVGPYSVGSPSATSLANYVAAPLVKVVTPQPGGGQIQGNYAWWVGDEGVKAKINVPRTQTDNTSYHSLVAQRRGWETVAGFSSYPLPTDAAQNSLTKLATLAETPLLIPSVRTATGGVSALQSVFHAATVDSKGLLVDNLNGGTRIDLTATLNSDLTTTAKVSSIANYPVKNGNLVPRSVGRTMVAPKWDAVKEFYDGAKNLQSGSLVVKQATTEVAAAIAPIVTDLRILLGVKFVASGADFKVNPCGKVAIAIANPYSVPLKWNSDLEVELFNQTPYGNAPARIWNLGNNSVFVAGDPNENALFNQAIFRIKAGSLATGEARAYTLGSASFRALNTGNQRFVVDLVPMASASAFDFSQCLEMDTNGVYHAFPLLDVREKWQTTQLGMKMSLGNGSSSNNLLREIDRFELDNGYYYPNSRAFTLADATAGAGKPYPLMCYSFQVSQPGVNYVDYMPAGYEMGQRSSTLRTFTDFNLQATRIPKLIASYNPAPYFMESNNSISQLGLTAGETGLAFTRNLVANPMPWGRGPNGSRTNVLFSIPPQCVSLAQLQHADLTGDDTAASIGHQPGNAVGNSYAPPFVKRGLTMQSRTDYVLVGDLNHSGATQTLRNYYDLSYLLNASLWDGYFFSTISTSTATPENPNLMRFNADAGVADLKDPVNAAGRLMVDGAFNVNCTDKNAWKAFFASAKHFKHKADSAASTNAAFPRSLEQPNSSANPPTGSGIDSYAGFRRLTDKELDALATEMVKQVRLRGPFVSLAHFVNRGVGDISRQAALTRSGAIQSAIDEAGLTINAAGTLSAYLRGLDVTADRVTLAEKNGAPRADMDGTDTSDRPADVDSSNPDWANTSTDNNFGAVASIVAEHTLFNSQKNEQGYRSTGIPGWLTQADVLQVIGPSLSARSDTFRIRSYGEALDSSGHVVARSWCEAIVQRVPNYVDSSNVPSARGAALSLANKNYGRRFEVVSFRWLSPNEI